MIEKTIYVGHYDVDFDLVAAIFFHLANSPGVGINLKKMLKVIEKNGYMAFSEGNKKIINNLANLILVDRGQGPFDHHGYGKEGETSASLMVRHYKNSTPTQEKFLRLVYRHDKKGETLVCDASHISKCVQRNSKLTDIQRIKIGLELIFHAILFGEKKLKRNNAWVRDQIIDFLKTKNIIPPNLQRYVDLLESTRFSRPFDIVEILTHKKEEDGEEAARDLAEKVLEFVYADGIMIFDPGLAEDVEKTKIINIRGSRIAAGKSDHLKFNTMLRNYYGANIVVQGKSDGHLQTFFETGTVDEEVVLNITSMIRLEECLIQHRSIPRIDLRRKETVKGIPEWYLYKGEPKDQKCQPAYFVFNGSQTAPDVPVSKIPFETIVYIITQAVRYKHLNWSRWKSERINYYKGLLSKKLNA